MFRLDQACMFIVMDVGFAECTSDISTITIWILSITVLCEKCPPRLWSDEQIAFLSDNGKGQSSTGEPNRTVCELCLREFQKTDKTEAAPL